MKTRLFWLALGVAYTVWPMDLIPDVPGVGWVDDAVIDLICAAMVARKGKRK